ncbi:unnamed protein product [Meloidogyne enterolobii]|uniref:Uncharacterized protein n=1 Tax=Meloidogyne enterolobii TaxID=390850 RepID=A0ACB0YPG4_MELEN
MVPVIIFDRISFPNFQLNNRAENVEIKELNIPVVRYTNYQISNIYNPKERFSFCNKEWNGSVVYIKIKKLKIRI